MNRRKLIEAKLLSTLSPSFLEVIDESHLHVGHAGAQSGKGHFKVIISSEMLTGLNRIQQHQLVYKSLGSLMETEIHALSIVIQ